MFKQCEVYLRQTQPGHKEKWLFVKLTDAQIPAMDARTMSGVYKYIASHGAMIGTFTYWGKWRTGPSSETPFAVTEGFSLGNTSAPQLWVYRAGQRQLDFLDVAERGPRQLTFSNPGVWGSRDGLATLFDVHLTGRGVFPASGSSGSGRCGTRSNLFQSGAITWAAERASFHY
jgi:hypothetical protein